MSYEYKDNRDNGLYKNIEEKLLQLSVAADLLQENNLLDEFRRRVRVQKV